MNLGICPAMQNGNTPLELVSADNEAMLSILMGIGSSQSVRTSITFGDTTPVPLSKMMSTPPPPSNAMRASTATPVTGMM